MRGVPGCCQSPAAAAAAAAAVAAAAAAELHGVLVTVPGY